MSLDPDLLSILVCPADKGPLRYVENEQLLYNPRLGVTYQIRDGIPVMLIEESISVDEAERARLDALAES